MIIQGFHCVESDGLRCAVLGGVSASFENGELMCFGKLPREVLLWLIEPLLSNTKAPDDHG